MENVEHGRPVTREDVKAVIGPVDEMILSEIIGMGATAEELAEAAAWVGNDEALINSGRPLATGRVGRLVELLARESEDAEDEMRQ
jgi:hypothetical protein